MEISYRTQMSYGVFMILGLDFSDFLSSWFKSCLFSLTPPLTEVLDAYPPSAGRLLMKTSSEAPI